MMHAIRHLKRALDDRSRALDQQHADAASVEERDALVGGLTQEFATDDLGVELRTAIDIADGNAEMRDAPDFRHGVLLSQLRGHWTIKSVSMKLAHEQRRAPAGWRCREAVEPSYDQAPDQTRPAQSMRRSACP